MHRWKLAAIGLALIVVSASSATVVANHLTTTPTFTGCLNRENGTIVKVKQGQSPKSACGA